MTQYEITVTKQTALQKRLNELKIINPNNLKCSTCNYYPGWISRKCKSINPLYFCKNHTGLIND